MASGGYGTDDDDVAPSAHALSASAKACAVLRDLRAGACVHGTVVVLSALVDMYGHSGAPGDARRAFEEMRAPDGMSIRAERLVPRGPAVVRAMVVTDGVLPDGCTFGSVMTALGNLKRARQGREAHAQVVTRGLCGNVIVESSTLDTYAKCGMMVDARKVFDRMKVRNAVSWCSLLGGYCQSGMHEKFGDLPLNPDVAVRVAKKMMELEPQYHLSRLLENVQALGDAERCCRCKEVDEIKKGLVSKRLYFYELLLQIDTRWHLENSVHQLIEIRIDLLCKDNHICFTVTAYVNLSATTEPLGVAGLGHHADKESVKQAVHSCRFLSHSSLTDDESRSSHSFIAETTRLPVQFIVLMTR
ncbi:unnamed protein product [Miscanthus lutarioriparius]|uniref:Uncharacterized protein n=1 Tax=Miscanthus lutarioriparius TaxID=422564 RepID=A0A811S5J8_9POAL|nr:unnamed protein product [Miscanthus lutarioriparius]